MKQKKRQARSSRTKSSDIAIVRIRWERDVLKSRKRRSKGSGTQRLYGETHCPRILFILNMSILSVWKTAFKPGSQTISLLLDGSCNPRPLMYPQSCLTTCGRERRSVPSTADSGPLKHETSVTTYSPRHGSKIPHLNSNSLANPPLAPPPCDLFLRFGSSSSSLSLSACALDFLG